MRPPDCSCLWLVRTHQVCEQSTCRLAGQRADWLFYRLIGLAWPNKREVHRRSAGKPLAKCSSYRVPPFDFSEPVTEPLIHKERLKLFRLVQHQPHRCRRKPSAAEEKWKERLEHNPSSGPDPFHSSQGTTANPNSTPSFQVGMWVHDGSVGETLTQILNLNTIDWRRLALKAHQAQHTGKTQQLNAVVYAHLHEHVAWE